MKRGSGKAEDNVNYLVRLADKFAKILSFASVSRFEKDQWRVFESPIVDGVPTGLESLSIRLRILLLG